MILLIYNEMVCREELLPNVYDTDYRVRLHKSIYSLHDDITLQLERTAVGWTLRSAWDYQVFSDRGPVKELLLEKEQILQIRTRFQENLIVMTADVPDLLLFYGTDQRRACIPAAQPGRMDHCR